MTPLPDILYTCPFVPGEWIRAHGLVARRIFPGATSDWPVNGVCPYAAGWVHVLKEEPMAAAVFTTTCDQMRRIFERVQDEVDPLHERLFLMHVPTTWQSQNARDAYASEVLRMGRFLERIGGTAPSANTLAETMREAQANVRGVIHSSRTPSSRGPLRGSLEGGTRNNIPLALVGSPLMAEQRALFDCVATAGGIIVLDATPSGELGQPGKFNEAAIDSNPFKVLVDAYFDHIPDAFRRPDSMLYEWLAVKLVERGVRGIIFHAQIWCDTWRGEARRLSEWSPVPVLTLDAEEGHAWVRAGGRIQAFVEALQ
jgi:benzoyl-CoA reductase/2-hydroxyglutaryl-CoA dehydratase subunit BcrC/BadD/HgdB